MANESFFDEAMAAIRECDKEKAIDVATRALAAGVSPEDMLKKGFVPGIARMGTSSNAVRSSFPSWCWQRTR